MKNWMWSISCVMTLGCAKPPQPSKPLRTFSLSVQTFINDTSKVNTIVDSAKNAVRISGSFPNILRTLNYLTEVCDKVPVQLNHEVIEAATIIGDSSILLRAFVQKAILMAKDQKLGASDSILKKVENLVGSDTTLYTKTHSLLGESQRIQNRFDEALVSYNEALLPARRQGDKERMAYCYHKIGVIKGINGDKDSADYYLKMALIASKSCYDAFRQISIFNSLSDFSLGYELRTRYLDSSIALSRSIKDHSRLTKVYLNKGFICAMFNNYPAAINYGLKGRDLALKMRDTILLMDAAQVLTRLYDETKEYERAIEVGFAGLSMAEATKNTFKQLLFNSAIGQAYLSKRNYLQAEIFLKKAELMDSSNLFIKSLIARNKVESGDTVNGLLNFSKIIYASEKLNDPNVLAFCHNFVGNVYLEKSDFEKAKKSFESGKKYGEAVGIPEHVMNSCLGLANLNERVGNIRIALIFNKKYHKLKDSISGSDKIKEVLNISYLAEEAKLKESQALRTELFRKEQILKDEELASNKKMLWIFVSGFLLFVMLSAYIFSLLKVSKLKSLKIEEQKKLVEEKQNEILSSIRYAKRIQMALLTSEKYIENKLSKIR